MTMMMRHKMGKRKRSRADAAARDASLLRLGWLTSQSSLWASLAFSLSLSLLYRYFSCVCRSLNQMKWEPQRLVACNGWHLSIALTSARTAVDVFVRATSLFCYVLCFRCELVWAWSSIGLRPQNPFSPISVLHRLHRWWCYEGAASN